MKNILFKIIFAFCILLSTQGMSQFYTGSQMEFGKNRVQYKELTWTFYNYERYQIYFYEGGMEIAKYVSKSAQKNIIDIERIFDYSLDGGDKIQFIVYNKQTDFQQTNIGLSNDEQYNIGGVTRIVGNKIALYFDGDHTRLEQQIRAGIAEIFINQMMYGGDVRQMIKNSTLLTLPDWYKQGLISYISTPWNTDLDNRVNDGIQTNKYKKFNRLTGVEAIAAGHAMWHYIAETYGEGVISNMLYMTKVSRSVESAFVFVIGTSIKNLTMEWLGSYTSRYAETDKRRVMPDVPELLKKPKASRIYNQVKVSPDGKHVVYATNEMGQYKVWLIDLNTKEVKRILKVGHKLDRIPDYSYPLLAWHPTSQFFSIISEKKGELMLTQYILETKEKTDRAIINFEKITDFSYSDDGKKFAMAAVQNGQSDIFVFTAASNGFEQVTKDIYDDVQPRFVHNSKEVIFASNRPDDTIRFVTKNEVKLLPANKDIFVYNFQTKSRVLRRITDTPDENESYPGDNDSATYSFLSDKNGIRNQFVASVDSVISFVDTSAHYRYVVKSYPVTNYKYNIIEQDVNIKAAKTARVIFYNGKHHMFATNHNPADSARTLTNTFFKNQQQNVTRKNEATKALMDSVKTKKEKETEKVQKEIDINNYSFEEDKKKQQELVKEDVPEDKPAVADTIAKVAEADEFVLAKQRNYTINFFVDYVVSQMDNSFMNATYQKFTGGGSPIYLNPGFTGFFKVGLSDLFEDYRIVAGFRTSFDLNNKEYFISYENRLKLLDKQIVVIRQSFMNVFGSSSLVKVHTNEAKYSLKYPFSEVAAIKGTINARNDRTVFLSTDLANLEKPDENNTWGGAKLEYIFDNSIKTGLNLFNGIRAKAFFEYFRQINKTETDLYVAGLDFRHYQKVHRGIIWANRFAASSSFGRQKLIYYMGGVDNWFFPKFDRSITVATDQNYAYQTLATNMRGFFQNVRNGNSFAVINSELRVPFFRYLINRPIKNDFINNFLVIAFGDVGTAWTGYSPYSEDNSLNKIIVGAPGNPIKITLNSQKEPIVGGYGWGVRSRLWGYYVRLDRAWGVDDGVVLPKITYLSFSLDF